MTPTISTALKRRMEQLRDWCKTVLVISLTRRFWITLSAVFWISRMIRRSIHRRYSAFVRQRKKEYDEREPSISSEALSRKKTNSRNTCGQILASEGSRTRLVACRADSRTSDDRSMALRLDTQTGGDQVWSGKSGLQPPDPVMGVPTVVQQVDSWDRVNGGVSRPSSASRASRTIPARAVRSSIAALIIARQEPGAQRSNAVHLISILDRVGARSDLGTWHDLATAEIGATTGTFRRRAGRAALSDQLFKRKSLAVDGPQTWMSSRLSGAETRYGPPPGRIS